MIYLGEKQELVIVKTVDFGVYLASSQEEAQDRVLLPRKQVPEGSRIGDKVTVFVYRDSKDRMIATVREPKLLMGQVAELEVVQVGQVGAFLDWGLEKDLMLPFKQHRGKVKQGDRVLVSLYIDKSSRLCATMNVYENLRTDSPYRKEDKVTGRVYDISDNFGAFVAVDNLYSALIPKKELYGNVELGKDVQARVVQVRGQRGGLFQRNRDCFGSAHGNPCFHILRRYLYAGNCQQAVRNLAFMPYEKENSLYLQTDCDTGAILTDGCSRLLWPVFPVPKSNHIRNHGERFGK